MSKVVAIKKPRAGYEAGKPTPYHVGPPQSRSADVEMGNAGVRMRNWARYLADNSNIVSAVLSSRVSNAIGPGLTYEPLVKTRKGELLDDLNDILRRIHERWSRRVDTSGEFSRQELERLAWRTWDLDGETFVRKVARRRDNQSLPYQLQQVETDWVPYNTLQVIAGNAVVHGIAKDTWGAPVRYYVDPLQQDTAYGYTGITTDPERMTIVPADDMWHLKRVDRVNQTRGVTLLHAVIFRIADIAEFQEAHRLAARASADQYASINRSPDMEVSDTATDRNWQLSHLQIIDELAPGESVNFHDPQHPNQNAVDFVREELRAIASGCDVGFSQIAQVFDSSYAAQRLEVVDTWRKVERDRSKFITDFARPALYEEVIRAAQLAGLIPQRLLRRADPQTLYDARIDGPAMPVIDPVKDRGAYVLDQENGWDSRQGIIRRMGKIPAQVDAERSNDSMTPSAIPPADDQPAGADPEESGTNNEAQE